MKHISAIQNLSHTHLICERCAIFAFAQDFKVFLKIDSDYGSFDYYVFQWYVQITLTNDFGDNCGRKTQLNVFNFD